MTYFKYKFGLYLHKTQKMDQKITLVISRICPFAHRAFITAHEKKLNFELKQVSLTNKEEFFTQTYHKAYAHDPKSNGKVPILVHGDQYLAESDLITWYLAESFETGSQLIPENKFYRAKVRHFSQTYPSKFFGAFYSFMYYNKKTEQEKKAVHTKLEDALSAINDAIEGPYAVGDQFTVADILIYPWFARWTVLNHYFGLTIDAKYTKIHNWLALINAREAIQLTTEKDQLFIEGYKEYFA